MEHLASIVADRYTIEREIGRGGMATVYVAWDEQQQRRVALKVLRPEIANAVSTERFLREIRLTGSFQHPHILPLYDSGLHGELPFYVMPFIEGESLRDRITREKQLPIDDAVSVALQVAEALTHAHAHGVLHRDISPANILLAEASGGGPAVFVADFGIARAVGESEGERLTSTGVVVGTADHMSPEQAAGDRQLDVRTDVYALASVLFEMLAGVPPFSGPTIQSVLGRKVTSRAPSVRELRPSVPEPLERAIARALETSPADRFDSAEEFAAALRHRRTTAEFLAMTRRSMRSGARRAALIASVGVGVVALNAIGIGIWNAPGRLLSRGLDALEQGRLGEAQALLRRAAARTTGPTWARANLGLAEALLLSGSDTVNEWRSAAAAGAADSAVAPGDRARAIALAAMARGDYVRGCQILRHAAATDHLAALELIDCVRRDRVVVSDTTSPSRWRFRSSYDEGVRVGRRVVDALAPDNALRRVGYREILALLRPENRAGRFGIAEADPNAAFVGFAVLDHDARLGDTVAFVPYPLQAYMRGRVPVNAARNERALEHDRALLRELAERWSRDFPADPAGHIELSRWLELAGTLTGVRPGDPSAVKEIATALQLTRVPAERVRIARAEARLLVKRGAFTRVRSLVDSVLAWPDSVLLTATDDAAALAALTGRREETVRFLQSSPDSAVFYLPNGRSYRPRPELLQAYSAVFGYAALGGPVDSLNAALAAFDARLASYTSPSLRDSVRAALLEYPLSLAVPVLGPAVVASLPGITARAVRVQQALARGDRSGVRAQLDSIMLVRSARLAASTTLDQTYAESWLRAAIGDTARAARQLDLTLEALPTLPATAFESVPEAAALGRAIALRVALARAQRDTPTARRWEEALAALWGRSQIAQPGPRQ